MKNKLTPEALEARREKAREEHFQKLQDKVKEMAENGTLQKRVANCRFATHIGKLSYTGANAAASWYEPSGTDTDSPYAALNSIQTPYIDCVYAGGVANSPPANILCELQEDGRPLLDHLREDDDLARRIFTIPGFSYEDIRNEFLRLVPIATSDSTDSNLHQVYFPVGDGDYHLLTILPSSSFLCELKRRYREMVESRIQKKGSGEEYLSFGNLVCVAYGGSHPNNISVLTFQGGKPQRPVSAGFFLLNSSAPDIREDPRNLPYGEFFEHCYFTLHLRRLYARLHSCFRGLMNFQRKQTAGQLQDAIFDQYLSEIYRLRTIRVPEGGWSDADNIHLPLFERHLLDAAHQGELTDSDLRKIASLAVSKFERFLYRATGKEPVFEPSYLSSLEKDWHRKLKLLFPTQDK